MSRSGYSEDGGDDDQWAQIRWRGAVASATRGKRGQMLLRELLEALDAMPVKELVAGSFAAEGEFCTLGVLGAKRGIDMSGLGDDSYCDTDGVAKVFDIAEPLAAEIMWENDEAVSGMHYVEVEGPPKRGYGCDVEIYVPDPAAGVKRWQYMRNWVAKQIKDQSPKEQSHG